MKSYLNLELKKFNWRRHLKGVLCIIAGMLLFETLGILNSNGAKDSYDAYLPRMISLLTTTCFIIYSSVFTTNLIIGEYSGKTILILFSYPVNRRRIILLKLGIVCVFTAICIIAGSLCCHLYLIGLDAALDIMEGTVTWNYIIICIMETLFGALMGGVVATLPFAVGMQKKSSAAAFIGSVCIAGIFFESVGIAPGPEIVLLIAAFLCVAAVLAVAYTLRCKVENLD